MKPSAFFADLEEVGVPPDRTQEPGWNFDRIHDQPIPASALNRAIFPWYCDQPTKIKEYWSSIHSHLLHQEG